MPTLKYTHSVFHFHDMETGRKFKVVLSEGKFTVYMDSIIIGRFITKVATPSREVATELLKNFLIAHPKYSSK